MRKPLWGVTGPSVTPLLVFGSIFWLKWMLKCMWMVLSWGGDLLETLEVMFYHLLDKKQDWPGEGKLKFTRNTEQTVQNMCCSRMCSLGMGAMHWWLMGESLPTLRHPHLRPVFRMPSVVSSVEPSQCLPAFTWMILVWGQPLTTLISAHFQTRSSGSPSVCKIPHILRVNYFSA